MDKVYQSADEAVADIPDGSTIAVAGFFTCGTPVPLIQALARQKARDLTLVCQQVGPGTPDVTQLVINGQVKKAICNYPFFRSVSRGQTDPFEQAVRAGKIEVEVYPMGTLIEKLRSAGAGIGAFYTPIGVGTAIEMGKEKRRFGDREYLLEAALKPDYALVYAHKGDRVGNLVFRKTARNYNPEMAKAARVAIAAVENLVDPGDLDPDAIHLPGIYVQRVVPVTRPRYIPNID